MEIRKNPKYSKPLKKKDNRNFFLLSKINEFTNLLHISTHD